MHWKRFYATLQALALNESTIERIEDTIQPHREGLVKIVEGIDEKYKNIIFEKVDANRNDSKSKKKKKKLKRWNIVIWVVIVN